MDKERHQAAADWATTWLSRAFPGSFPDEGSTAERNKLLLALLDEHPWIEPKAWEVGIKAVCWQHMGDYMPPPAKIIEAVRADQDERRRKNEQALPPPKRSESGPNPAHYARNIAIGKARQRKRKAFINAYRATLPPGVWKYGGEQSQHWHGRDTPTEEEIDTVLLEMRTNGQIGADVLEEALALRVPINILNVPWVKSPIEMGVPGEVAEAPTDTPLGPTVTVRWADGKETRTQVLDEDHARLANRWLRKHNPGQEN